MRHESFKSMLTKPLLLAAMLLSACCGWAQPVATWLETEHDFGSFSDSIKTVSCEMRLVNTGSEPLVIVEVKPSCGCTAVEYPREPIAPADTAIVQLRYDSRKIPGEFEKNVLVYTNTVPRKTMLVVKGLVIGSPETIDEKYPYGTGPVKFSHNSLPLGTVTRGKWREAFFTGYNTARQPMRVAVTGLPQHMSARVLPDTIMPGKLVTVSLFYDSWRAPLWGLNTDTIAIHAMPIADSTQVVTMPFTVMAQVKEDFSKLTDKQRRDAPDATFSTDKLDFGTFSGNASCSFTIKNNGKSNLVIRRLFVPDAHITAQTTDLEIKKGKQTTVTVQVNDFTEPVLNTSLTVITNDPYRPQQEVRLVGINKTSN